MGWKRGWSSDSRSIAPNSFWREHANVQPHSGTSANIAVFMALLEPGDKILGMNLTHGGHLSHGHPMNYSGKFYTIIPYGVSPANEQIDYDELERLAHANRPKLILLGASAYPRVIDFERGKNSGQRGGSLDGGYGSFCGFGGDGPSSQSSSICRHCDDDNP